MQESYDSSIHEVSKTLKILSHPKRLFILCLLKDGEKNVGEIQRFCKISQSQTSQFLTQLTKMGYLECRKDATLSYYSLHDPKIVSLLSALSDLYCPHLFSHYLG